LTIVGDSEVNNIIKRSMLCDGDEDGLVVGGSIDGRYLVSACGQATSNSSRQDTVGGGIIQALEEGELCRVGGRSLGET